jgi:hypothetical protein
MRSIIKTDKPFNKEKRISISPVLTYINNDLRKSSSPPPKLHKNNRIKLNNTSNDSDFEYY